MAANVGARKKMIAESGSAADSADHGTAIVTGFFCDVGEISTTKASFGSSDTRLKMLPGHLSSR